MVHGGLISPSGPTGIQSSLRNQFVCFRNSTRYYHCFQQALFRTLPYISAHRILYNMCYHSTTDCFGVQAIPQLLRGTPPGILQVYSLLLVSVFLRFPMISMDVDFALMFRVTILKTCLTVTASSMVAHRLPLNV